MIRGAWVGFGLVGFGLVGFGPGPGPGPASLGLFQMVHCMNERIYVELNIFTQAFLKSGSLSFSTFVIPSSSKFGGSLLGSQGSFLRVV